MGIFLPEHLKGRLKVQFERNVSFFFGKSENNFTKKEIDIVLFDQEKKEKYAIEVKFPRNGQFPEQMYSFIKDICFMEQLKEKGFTKTFAVCLVDNANFYEGNAMENKIYRFFRNQPQPIQGNITKSTGDNKDKHICVRNPYQIVWQELKDVIAIILLKFDPRFRIKDKKAKICQF